MTATDRRRNVRLNLRFRVKLCRDGLNLWFEGISANLSQVGAYIETKDWSFFQVHDQTIITCFLPPDFTGQNNTISMQGAAIIRRIDHVNEGVAVEFVKSFKQFEPCVDESTRMGHEGKA
jgi:hypothetical protein